MGVTILRSKMVIPAQAGISLDGAKPRPSAQAWVYILTNQQHNVFYIGASQDVPRRFAEHARKNKHGFTAKYNLDKLIYAEPHSDMVAALKRERQLKKWNRDWKEGLINQHNPTWTDLATMAF